MHRPPVHLLHMVDEEPQERTVRAALVHTHLVRKEILTIRFGSLEDFIHEFQYYERGLTRIRRGFLQTFFNKVREFREFIVVLVKRKTFTEGRTARLRALARSRCSMRYDLSLSGNMDLIQNKIALFTCYLCRLETVISL